MTIYTIFKIFSLIWVIYSLQNELRSMRYELSFKWLLRTFRQFLDCWYCFTFWSALALTQDVFIASCLSFCAYIIEKLLNIVDNIKI